MQKRIASLLVIMLLAIASLAPVALAKDGPFPVAQSAGTWVAENHYGLVAKLAAGVKAGIYVQVNMTLENSYGDVLAFGTTVHDSRDDVLRVEMMTKSGKKLLAVVDSMVKPDGSKHLVLTVYLKGTTTPIVDGMVLNRAR